MVYCGFCSAWCRIDTEDCCVFARHGSAPLLVFLVILAMAKCLLLDSKLVDDFVSRNNIRREGGDLLFFLIGLHGALQCNFAVYRNDLDVVRISREILVTDDRFANLGGCLTVS